jgi:hypothetical protein
MGTQYAPVDPMEQDLAAAQLDDIALAYTGRPWAAWKDVILRWHLEAVARARAEAWVPGMAASQDPVVEETLYRFYRHHMRVAIGQLRTENLELRRRFIDAVGCARFYATGATDAGQRAQALLAGIEPRVVGGTAPASPTQQAIVRAAV